ncbi:MAG TPA: SUMF1/EgtB/PvdO family nonheme iron enzyme, partial [Polyangiaceae bacterium]|nr:SUMF1/EgtB/PvdO family nonheme iron enzyme [Polyangiaceae bacterium]
SKLPGLGADAGALWQAAPDATAGNGADAPDSTLGDARDEDSTPETSDDAEASNNAEASDDTNAGDGAEAGDDANAGDDAKAGGDEGTPLNIPCDAPCALGQQCVQGRCVPIPPSCSSGGPGAGRNCGLAAADDCCAGDEIPSGTFFRDYDGLMYQDKSNPATVSQFRLDRYEVTVGRFRAFVSVASAGDGAPAWTPAAGDGKHTHINGTQGLSNGSSAGVRYETGWDASWNVHLPQTKTDWDKQLTKCVWNFVPNGTANTWTAAPGPNENKPIDCLNWYEAYAFCIWDGGFLPSAAEWDYAAAGGTNQNEYAWGAADPGNNADLAVYACFFPHLPYGNHLLGVQNVAPVGLAPKGVGVWGQLDLNGNAIEWILDFSPAPYLLPCVDCAVTASGTQRGLRGGGFDSDLTQLPNSYWVVSPPEQSDAEAGVRCARSPLP